MYFGSQAGKVYSLDARTGCVHWYFDAGAGVRAAIALTNIVTNASAGASQPRNRAFAQNFFYCNGLGSLKPASDCTWSVANPLGAPWMRCTARATRADRGAT